MEMSALKFLRSEKSSLMSVMAETFQSAMGPYVSMAPVGLASYSLAAILSASSLVKILTRRRRCRMGGTRVPARSALVVKLVVAVPRMFI